MAANRWVCVLTVTVIVVVTLQLATAVNVTQSFATDGYIKFLHVDQSTHTLYVISEGKVLGDPDKIEYIKYDDHDTFLAPVNQTFYDIKAVTSDSSTIFVTARERPGVYRLYWAQRQFHGVRTFLADPKIRVITEGVTCFADVDHNIYVGRKDKSVVVQKDGKWVSINNMPSDISIVKQDANKNMYFGTVHGGAGVLWYSELLTKTPSARELHGVRVVSDIVFSPESQVLFSSGSGVVRIHNSTAGFLHLGYLKKNPFYMIFATIYNVYAVSDYDVYLILPSDSAPVRLVGWQTPREEVQGNYVIAATTDNDAAYMATSMSEVYVVKGRGKVKVTRLTQHSIPSGTRIKQLHHMSGIDILIAATDQHLYVYDTLHEDQHSIPDPTHIIDIGVGPKHLAEIQKVLYVGVKDTVHLVLF